MISPDSFPYFLFLFSVGIFSGTYLLFTHYINRLLVLNTIVLFLAALRVASEYYIQQLETYEQVMNYAPLHILPVNLLIPIQWAMILFYVRPFSGWKWEKVTSNFLLFSLIIIPFLGHNYFCTIDPQLFYYHTERINGYWQFAVNTSFWYHGFYSFQSQLVLLLLLATLLVGIIRNKHNRIRQSFLLATYIFSYFVYFSMTRQGEWNIPSTGILYLIHSLLISWYVSEYRLFKSNFNLITKSLFESISDLTISTDPKLNITGVNAKTTATFAPTAGNMRQWLNRNYASAQQRDDEKFQQLLNQELPSQELVLKDQSGQVRTFDLKVAPFKNGDRLHGYTFLLTDLTEARQKEAELAELNASKDRLFAIIAHDLRKPALSFRGIGKKINYLISKNDFERLQSFGNSLENTAFSLNNLLDNLLGWASQQRNMLPYNPQLINLLEIAQEATSHIIDQAKNKEINLQMIIPPDIFVYADPNAVLTIIRNLVRNAVKFTERSGAITINIKASTTNVTLLVSDSGIGISSDALLNLFDLSKQRKKDGTEGEKGTGIGLYLVKELVVINQGSISVESSLTNGTTFSVTLPTTNT
jgi:signal transduction histidine kinase